MEFEYFRLLLIGQKIAKWNQSNEIILNNDVVISIKESAWGDNTEAVGYFKEVKTNLTILDVSFPIYHYRENNLFYETEAKIEITFSDLSTCFAYAKAKVMGDYDNSAVSLVVKVPGCRKSQIVYFVSAGDK